MKFIKCETISWENVSTYKEGETIILNSSYIESIEKLSLNCQPTPEAEKKYSEKFDVPASELCLLRVSLASKNLFTIVIPEKGFDNFKN